jgi:hypothetical protein
MLPNTWTKARKSGGNDTGPNCVEALNFRKATKSTPECHCVEVTTAKATHANCLEGTCLTPGISDGDIIVRDSKLGDDSPWAVFTPEQWAAYTAEVASGRSDVEGADYVLRDPRGTGVVLRYTAAEWDAFTDGCRRSEFAVAAS